MVLLTQRSVPIVVVQHPHLLENRQLNLLIVDQYADAQSNLKRFQPIFEVRLALEEVCLLTSAVYREEEELSLQTIELGLFEISHCLSHPILPQKQFCLDAIEDDAQQGIQYN